MSSFADFFQLKKRWCELKIGSKKPRNIYISTLGGAPNLTPPIQFISEIWTLGAGEYKQLHSQPDPCDCHHLCQYPSYILLWVSFWSLFSLLFHQSLFMFHQTSQHPCHTYMSISSRSWLLNGKYLSDFSLVNPMTWYKEEFPGVMAFTGKIMKGMGYTGDYFWGNFISF